jgi:hypothetical protein
MNCIGRDLLEPESTLALTVGRQPTYTLRRRHFATEEL